MNEQQLFEAAEKNLIPFYKRFPRAFVKGKGNLLTDVEGRKILDFTAGIATINLGHGNSKVNRAIFRALKKQLKKISHMSNVFYIPPQIELAELLSIKAFDGKSFFCNSGTEANEAAMKIARAVGNQKSVGKNKLLSLEKSFHGRTIAAITLTGQTKYQKGIEPLLPGIDYVKPNDLADLEAKFDDSVCAIFMESVQAEGGVYPLSDEFVARARELCDRHDALLIFDEVQTGIGRTGKYFGFQNYDVQPDVITMAKALGNGFPVGAVHITEKVNTELPAAGLHASTFGGNYLAMSAGIAVLSQLNEKMLERVNHLGEVVKKGFEGLKAKYPDFMGDIRGMGLIWAVDLKNIDVLTVISSLLDRGIATLRAGDNALRILPPFTVTEKQIGILMTDIALIFEELK